MDVGPAAPVTGATERPVVSTGVELARRIEAVRPELTGAERRVAEAILKDPQALAFGTVATVAREADAGAATVVRLAAKLGFGGFSELQASVQRDLVASLGPAADRIHELDPEDASHPHGATELANVETTLAAVHPDALEAVTALLADLDRVVLVGASESAGGVATQFTGDLSGLRPGVERLDGNEVTVARRLALAADRGVLLVVDVARYDRWLLAAFEAAGRVGIARIALTDSILSPLADHADEVFTISVDSTTPFESHVGTMALMNRIILSVADRLRPTATERLADVERAWRDGGALTDG